MSHNEKYLTARVALMDGRSSDHDEAGDVIHENDTILHGGKRFCVLKEGGSFHLRRVLETWHGGKPMGYKFAVSDPYGELYRPIHSSVTYHDVEGATYAWDDGTAWHFAHCSPDEQTEFARLASSFAVAQFGIPIAQAQLKVVEATNDVAKTVAITRATALISFAQTVGERVYRVVTGQVLGYYHARADDHYASLAADAIDYVLGQWKKSGLANSLIRTQRSAVLPAANLILISLRETALFEFRGQRAARLEAAKKAAAAADSDSDDDHSHDSGGDGH